MAKYYQHGEVLFKVRESIPESAEKVKPSNGVHVVAVGTATGNAHTVDAKKADMYKNVDGELFVDVKEGVVPGHEEHNVKEKKVLPAGIYCITKVKEQDPLEKEIREVAD